MNVFIWVGQIRNLIFYLIKVSLPASVIPCDSILQSLTLVATLMPGSHVVGIPACQVWDTILRF